MSRSVTMLLAAALALIATTTSVSAHARPETSTPAPGARLDAAPAQAAFDFTIDSFTGAPAF
jgi:methionine-rich copper-binding protein CopC